MNFESAFLGPQSIQVYHLRSKTPLTSVDRLRGPPRRSNVDRIFANHHFSLPNLPIPTLCSPGLAWCGSAGAGPAVASDEAAWEASEGRDGARMGRVGVWRASPAGAGRVTAARRRPKMEDGGGGRSFDAGSSAQHVKRPGEGSNR